LIGFWLLWLAGAHETKKKKEGFIGLLVHLEEPFLLQ